jgi:hypothetical protein
VRRADTQQCGNLTGGNQALLDLLHGEYAVECAVHFADIAECDFREHLRHAGGEAVRTFGGLAYDDRDTFIVRRRRDVGDEPTGEAGLQPALESAHLGGRPIRGEHDLAAACGDGIPDGEQIGLQRTALGQQLHVVEEQYTRQLEPLPKGFAPAISSSLGSMDA